MKTKTLIQVELFLFRLGSYFKITKTSLFWKTHRINFECSECGWKGRIDSFYGSELVMGTYCPMCSDQK